MVLKFSDNFCTACEPIARSRHKGNDPIRCRPAITVVVDVHLPMNQFDSPGHRYDNNSTYSGSSIERVVTSSNIVSTGKNTHSAHLEIPKVDRLRMMEGAREGKKSARRPEDPQL